MVAANQRKFKYIQDAEDSEVILVHRKHNIATVLHLERLPIGNSRHQ